MRLSKHIQNYLLKSAEKSTWFSFLKFLIYIILIFIEIIIFFLWYIIFRLFIVFPIYLGYLLLKISVYLPIFYFFLWLVFSFKTLLFKIKIKIFGIIKFIISLLIIFKFKDYIISNSNLGWSKKFWFNKVNRTTSLEIDFIEYNRSLSKLLFRKNFKPLNILISEKGLSNFFSEFKLKIFEGIPKFRYSKFEPATEVFYKNAIPLLYRIDIDYSDFEFLSKYSVSEVDLKDVFYLRQHKHTHYLFLNSIFNFVNQLNFKYIFDLEKFYNFNSFFRNYHDDFIIIRGKLRNDDFNLLEFDNINFLTKNNENSSNFFYSGNNFWERFAFDSFLSENGAEMDELNNVLYVPESIDVYEYPNQFFNMHDTTLINYLFGGSNAFYQNDISTFVGYTRSLGYPHYDFDLGERFFFWNFKMTSFNFGNDKFDTNINENNENLLFSRYGVLGPLLLHDWNLFYPHFFNYVIDLKSIAKGNYNIDYLGNVQNYQYYNNFFNNILKNFSFIKSKNILLKFDKDKNIELKKFPPLLHIPRLNDSRLISFENEVQSETDFFLTKYAKNTPKYPFCDLHDKIYLAKKTNVPLWMLKNGKYNHELLWSSRTLSPFSLSPTKSRLTTSDFWILRKSFLKGFLSVKEIYYYLKTYKFFFFLRNFETKIIYTIFNYLPSELILVEFKYFLLNFLLKFSFLDQILIYLTNFFNFDCLNFKWFLIRLIVVISDIYLWFIFAYLKIIVSILLNIFFDDISGLLIYYIKVFEIYYIDSFIPLKSYVTNKGDFFFNEFLFKYDLFEEMFDMLNVQNDVMPHKGKKTRFIANWVRPSERNKKSLYGFYYPTKFRFFYYDIYERRTYRRKTSFTWRRGNTVLFGYGNKSSFRDFYSKKTVKLKRLMRYETGVSKRFRMHHIRKRPFKGFWTNYNFLNFNYHYGIRNQYYTLSFNNFLLFEKSQNYNLILTDLSFNNKSYYQYFFNFFNTSIRPKNLSSVFKHFYFFNNFKGFNFFSSRDKSLYKYDFHYIPFSGLKKSNKLKFSIPFLDLLSLPNQYLLQKPRPPSSIFIIYKFLFGVTLYKPKVPKTNYYPIMYKHSPVYQYRQYLMLLNWHALILHGFINTSLYFYPIDLHYKRINLRDPQYLSYNFFNFENQEISFNFSKNLFYSLIYFFFNSNTLQYFIAKQHMANYIKLQNVFIWSNGDHIKFWNYTSPYMERNFVDFFWIPITSLYTSRFLDDGMRLENGFGILSYNSVLNRLYTPTRTKGTKNFSKKEVIMFIPGTGVEPLEQFFWTHNQHDYDFYYLVQQSREWPISDLQTLEDNRFLNIYTQPHKNRPFMLEFDLIEKSSSSIEIEPGIDVSENQFADIDTYYIWKRKRLRRSFLKRRIKRPYSSYYTRLRHFQYKITSGRKITVFLIIVWYKFIYQLCCLIKFIIIYYYFEFFFFYLIILFFLINLYCFKLTIEFFFIQQRNLTIWFSERMLLYEKIKIENFESLLNFKELNDILKKDFDMKLNFFFPHLVNVFKISNNFIILRNFLLINFVLNFFTIYKNFLYKYFLFNQNLIKKKFNLVIIESFLKIYINKLFIYFKLITEYKFFLINYFMIFFYFLNKKLLFFVFSARNYFLFLFFSFFKKIISFFYFFIIFSFFLFFLKEFLFYKNIYLTQISSIFLMFVFLLFFIWFLSIVSFNFVRNFLVSQYPIDQYLQDYSTDFVGESFVYEDSLYFYLQAFQEDELFDADSFPFYYSWFTQFMGTNFLTLFFARKASQINLENQKEANLLAGFGWDAENTSKIYGTPAYLKNSLKNFFIHVFYTLVRQKDMYRFNNDISIFYEYEESLKTVSNLVTKVNYNNSKNYKKFDLPWEIVDGFIYLQYLSNNFWYYHSELFYDTERVLYFNNAETATDYNEMMVLENKGDVPNEPISSFDLFEGDEGIELIEFNNEDFEIDDVPIELLDFSEETNLNFMFRYYENFFSKKNSLDNLINYNFYFNNDIAENLLVKNSGWIQEIIFDRFLLSIISKDFLFPSDNELLSFISVYFDEINIKSYIDNTFLQTFNTNFRDLLIKYMLQLKPTNIYRNNIYNSQTLLHLIRRLNYKKIPFKKIFVEYLKRFPKNRIVLGSYNEKLVSFRWDTGVDLMVSLYHPHDVLFKLTKNIGLFNFVPYHYFLKDMKFKIVPIIGYEMFNNQFKKKFFSNVPFFVKKLNLINYPDLTFSEAERLWAFLGCTKKEWESFDKDDKNLLIYPYDDWDFPFMLISFLFAIHYHKTNKLRGNIGIRGGAPIGFNIHSRFQLIRRTEKRQKWRKKKLLKPTDKSPLYYCIDFFETIISFFENFLFFKQNNIFFFKNILVNDLFIIFSNFQLFFLNCFSYVFYDYKLFDLFSNSNFLNLNKFCLSLLVFFKFYFFFFLLFFIFVYVYYFFYNFLIAKFFLWFKFSFFFFSTFFTILCLFFFKNLSLIMIFMHFFYFYYYYVYIQILNLLYLLFIYFII